MRPTYNVTTPIYYVNGLPHLGHAYTSTAADVLARWKRQMNYDVFFLTGVDEHGQKVEQAAANAGLDPQTYVDQMAQHFVQMNTQLNISNDYFIRTTSAEHKSFCQGIWTELRQRGYIHLGAYEGWYSTKDECFYNENEITRKLDGTATAIDTGSNATWIAESSYYFRLSLFKDEIRKHILSNPDFLHPISSRNEVLALLDLTEDVCVSRTSFSWGIKVPNDEAHVMYVWIDALMNYVSALATNKKLDFWPADLHLIGKEISRFHAIIWPALLMALDYPLPKKIFAHGWWTVEGRKMGKSANNAMSFESAIADFGLDRLRYYMLREMPFGNDGDFSRENFIRRTNADLANDLGNLAQRTLSIIAKQGKLPEVTQLEDTDTELLSKAGGLEKVVDAALDRQSFHEALDAVWEIIRGANAYISAQAPWSKDLAPTRAQTILGVLLEVQKVVATILTPFMPESMARLSAQLDSPLTGPTPIFPRIAT